MDTYPIPSIPTILRLIAHQKMREIPPLTQVVETSVGKHTRAIDKAFPGKHTKALYNGRLYSDAAILCQLRTGMCRLNGYLSRIKVVASPLCTCGVAEETVDHFFFRCSLWRSQRSSLRSLGIEAKWWDLSYFLGGYQVEDGPIDNWKPEKKAVAAAIRFAALTGHLIVEPIFTTSS